MTHTFVFDFNFSLEISKDFLVDTKLLEVKFQHKQSYCILKHKLIKQNGI